MTNSRFGAEFGLLVKRRRAERGLSQDQLAGILWPEKAGPKDHPNKPQLSRLESGKTANPQEKTVLALCEALGIREDEVNALRLAPPPDPPDLEGVAAFLARIEERSKADLEDLARHYGEEAPEDRSREWLLSFLREKAETIARLAQRIKDLEGLSPGIDNIRAEARRAILDGRLDDARRLLDGAREVRQPELRRAIETNATLMELSAEIDLLEGKPDHAFTLFSAAADSFAAVGVVEVARRRHIYADRLEEHGSRYGGAGLPLAIRLFDRLLADLPQDANPWVWAAAQNSLAIACQSLGQRGDGPEGTALLARAVGAFEAALQVLTRETDPIHWAMTLQNLAGALRAQGQRTAGEDGTRLLSRAAAAFEQALQVRTRAAHPVHWAMTMQNLANVLLVQGQRTVGGDGTALLSRAAAAYEQALQVFTRADHPMHWAGTMQNLAAALRAQVERTTGEAGTSLLSRAVGAYEQALQVFTRADHPVDWAGTMQNLANTLMAQGSRTAGGDGTALLARAVDAHEEALQVFTRADHPAHWAMTMQNLANALQRQGERTAGEAGTALLSRAVASHEQALQVRTRADQPVRWAMTQENLALCHAAWSEHPACDDPPAYLRQALAHVDAALTVYDPDHMPYDHGTATRLRGRILSALG